MQLTRRTSIQMALAGIAAAAMPARLRALTTGTTIAGSGVTIYPVEHASLYIQTPGPLIAVDPVGSPDLYRNLPPPGAILITHEHQDHFNLDTLTALAGDTAQIVVNPAVHAMLPEPLKSRAVALKNGEGAAIDGIAVEAVPAYNTTPDRLQYHPQGRDNGYVMNIEGYRYYIAGDTEPTDEMKALTDITVALLPMNLPYTMSVDQAAEAIAAFKPAVVYPYHHRGTDPSELAAKVQELGLATQVIMLDWYPASDHPTGE